MDCGIIVSAIQKGKAMDEATQPGIELPRYKCHKEVRALKIKAVVWALDRSLLITPEEEGYTPFLVEAKFVPSHDASRPEVGWYWVLYEDGYQSFSPAKAFEEGYTRL